MSTPLDFVAIGHITVDRLESGERLGGAAAYAALTASRLGQTVGIVTSVAADFPFLADLDGIEIHIAASERSTVFENVYRDDSRFQRLSGRAATLHEKDLANLRVAKDAVVLYCPVAREVHMPLTRLAPRGLCGVAPQGFFRQWDVGGRVRVRQWSEAAEALAHADCVCLSEDDLPAPEALAVTFPGKYCVVTRGAKGCRVYTMGDVRHFGAPRANEVDPTGAGDVFAAAFLVALKDDMALEPAVRFASAAAAIAVEGPGTSSIPSRAEVEARVGR